jgi:hypothetical protein
VKGLETPRERAIRELIGNYWLAAWLMHRQTRRYRSKMRSDWSRFHTYYSYWLSGLYVVCEGWRDLKLKDATIDDLIDKHVDALRIFRNGTFHYQRHPGKLLQFHNGPEIRLNWAEDLHAAFSRFFRQYVAARVREGYDERLR